MDEKFIKGIGILKKNGNVGEERLNKSNKKHG
jgi:hypothetical protein